MWDHQIGRLKQAEPEKRQEQAEIIKSTEFREGFTGAEINPKFECGMWAESLTREMVQKRLEDTEAFYRKAIELCGEETWKEQFETFLRAKAHTLELFEVEKPRDIPLHDLYPYWPDFDGIVRKIFRGQDVPAVKFEPNLVGRGAFGCIYRTGEYAVKLYWPLMTRGIIDNRSIFRTFYDIAFRNLKSSQDFFRGVFPKIHAVAGEPDGFDISFGSIMEYIPGDNLDNMVDNEDARLEETELTGDIARTYAKMLRDIHSRGRVFVDNCLSAIVVGTGIRIVDVDFVLPIAELHNGFYPHHRRYISQEHCDIIAPTPTGDLEAFALMLHHLITGEPFIKDDDPIFALKKEWDKAGKREYPAESAAMLPEELRQVMVPLIQYPRDESITAQDFVDAIERDYGKFRIKLG